MISKQDLKRQQERGARAKQLLSDSLIQDALHDIRALLYKKIETSAFDESDAREDCYRMLRSAETFEGMLKRHINTGKVAEDKLSGLKSIVKRVQDL